MVGLQIAHCASSIARTFRHEPTTPNRKRRAWRAVALPASPHQIRSTDEVRSVSHPPDLRLLISPKK